MMQTNSKVSPKSCSCTQCMRGKHSAKGHTLIKADERANRRAVKCKLAEVCKSEYNLSLVDELPEVDVTVPIGNYYD